MTLKEAIERAGEGGMIRRGPHWRTVKMGNFDAYSHIDVTATDWEVVEDIEVGDTVYYYHPNITFKVISRKMEDGFWIQCGEDAPIFKRETVLTLIRKGGKKIVLDEPLIIYRDGGADWGSSGVSIPSVMMGGEELGAGKYRVTLKRLDK